MYRNLKGCGFFVEGAINGLDISFYEFVGFWQLELGNCVFKALFVSKSVPFIGAEGFPIVGEYCLGHSFLVKRGIFGEIFNDK